MPLALALAGIAIGVLDAVGLLRAGWVAENLPGLCLLLLGFIALIIGTEHIFRFEQLSREVKESEARIIAATQGVKIKQFRNPLDYWSYCSLRLRTATTVADLTWGRSTARQQTAADAKAYETYRRDIARACRRGTVFREVFTFSSAIRLKRFRDVVDAKGTSSYSARFFDVDHDATPPLLQFMVFDNAEVVLGPHRGDVMSAVSEIYLSIEHPLISQLFVDYFEAIWIKALKLKDGPKLNEANLQQVTAMWP
ncbi:MAG: hypothetical protein QM733_04585 [Ilumatobacteraceae bacterium]